MWIKFAALILASGGGPFSVAWAFAYVQYLENNVQTSLHIWGVFVVVYILNSIFLDLHPGNSLQSGKRALSISKLFPIVSRNLFSCLFITRTHLPVRAVSDFELVAFLMMALVGNEVIYAPIHKLLHLPVFYRYHKDHHAQVEPRAFGAVYCSIVEMWVANMTSFLLPLYCLGAPASVFLAWAVSGIQTSQLHHSGKNYWWTKLSHQPKFHDDHHRLFTVNFGNIGILERVLSSKNFFYDVH